MAAYAGGFPGQVVTDRGGGPIYSKPGSIPEALSGRWASEHR